MLRKILEAFKTLSISVMKIEANILLIKLRLNKKIRDYTARIMILAEQHSIRLRTLSTFSRSESEYNIVLNLSSKFQD